MSLHSMAEHALSGISKKLILSLLVISPLALPNTAQAQWAQVTGGDTVYDLKIADELWRVHVFSQTGSNTLTVSSPGDIHYLIVGGGGAGGISMAAAGGGGGGGLLTSFGSGPHAVSAGSHEIVVGVGGAGGAGRNAAGSNGEDSSAFGLTALGGGGGGNAAGNPGGSGGGSNYKNSSPLHPGGSGTPGQGNDGGSGSTSRGGQWWNEAGGGGGGFSEKGDDATTKKAGDGGSGFNARAYLGTIMGDEGWFAGGGGGAKRTNNIGGLGGKGGGGGSPTGEDPMAGEANTGGGGGGGARGKKSADGGSGIVIVKYRPTNAIQLQDESNGAIIGIGEKAALPSARVGQSVSRTYVVKNRPSVSDQLLLTNDVAAVVFEESGTTTHGGFTIAKNIADAAKRIAPGTSASFTVQFAASALGTHSATILILHNDPSKEPYRFTLEAGVFDKDAPLMRVYDGERLVEANAVVSLGNRSMSTVLPQSKNFTIANAAGAPAKLVLNHASEAVVFSESGTTSHGGFTITSNLESNTGIAAGGSETFTVQFKSDEVGTHTTTVSVRNNDPSRDPYLFDVTSTVKDDRNTIPEPIDVTLLDEILEVIEVAPIWAVHPPGAPNLITRDGFQYILYYGGDGYLAVAQRKLPSKDWKFHTFPVRTGWATTGHGQITMAIDRDGYLHISAYRRALAEGPPNPYNIIYYRSNTPHSVDAFERLYMTTPTQRYDYPQFITNGKDIYFQYRDGGSGGGNYTYYAYNPDEKSWRILSGRSFLHGRGRMSPYAHLNIGPDGFWHLRWVWRGDPANHSNHSASYARSKDLENWETAGGEPIELPMTNVTEGVVIDPATKPRSGISNMHQGGLGFDSKMRPILSYHKFTDEEEYKDRTSQMFNARWEDGKWNIVQATDWTFKWRYYGPGTHSRIMDEGRVAVGDKPGTLIYHVRSRAHGQQIITLDEETLAPLETRDIEDPLWRDVLRQPESPFKARAMQVILVDDMGEPEEEGVRYVYRWERGGNNRDREVRKPWPEPTMLRVYKVKSD